LGEAARALESLCERRSFFAVLFPTGQSGLANHLIVIHPAVREEKELPGRTFTLFAFKRSRGTAETSPTKPEGSAPECKR
jgi:hypothetical protein